MRLDLRTFDVGVCCDDPHAFAAHVVELTLASWADGADLVVFPEFTWMGLERFVAGADMLAGVADCFWNRLWPEIQHHLSRPDKAVVLGTVPFVDADGRIKNRAPILSAGQALYQDKIHLTPWEADFRGGGPIQPWCFKGVKIAVVICLDIEIPEIAVALRSCQPDLIVVPSATENQLGVERIGRCADARAVELGCHVGVCHLVGKTSSDWVDENIGRLAFFSPSQSPFLEVDRHIQSTVHAHGFHLMSAEIDVARIRSARELPMETNPSRVRAGAVVVKEHPSSPGLQTNLEPEKQMP